MCLTLIVTGWPIGTEKQGLLAVTRLKPLKEWNWCVLLKRFKCTHVSYFDAFVQKKWTFQNDISSKNVRSAKYLFSKEFELSLTKNIFTFPMERKKLLPVKWTFFASKFSDKKDIACNKFFTSAREQKNPSFFFLIVKLFCHFMIDCSAEKLANSCFLPVDVFCEILPFILGNSSSDLHRVFFVFVQLWFKVDEGTCIPWLLISAMLYFASNSEGWSKS